MTYDKIKSLIKIIYIYLEKYTCFVARTKNSGVGEIVSYSVGFYIFIYFKKMFLSKYHIAWGVI